VTDDHRADGPNQPISAEAQAFEDRSTVALPRAVPHTGRCAECEALLTRPGETTCVCGARYGWQEHDVR
jgi:hypothetical protein